MTTEDVAAAAAKRRTEEFLAQARALLGEGADDIALALITNATAMAFLAQSTLGLDAGIESLDAAIRELKAGLK